jgi:uncharacterized repeat protein (TIGR04138 family)
VIELRLAPDLLARIREREQRYDEMAYLFVLGSIEYLQSRLPIRRHVTGAELARACRDHALEQFGLMARPVLDFWGIRRTEDLGRIVYTLVEVGLLVTQPGDSESDFERIFDFDQAFSTSYRWPGVRSGDPQAGEGGGAVLGEEV